MTVSVRGDVVAPRYADLRERELDESRGETANAGEGATRVSDQNPSTEVAAAERETGVTLVEIEPGLAILFADQPPSGLDFTPFEMMGEVSRRGLQDKLAIAVGGGNLIAQSAQASVSAQGLVRLAPETVELLKTFQPMTSGGWNLGPIVDQSGKIVAQARFAPALGAQSAAVLSSLGPAAALLAVQMQLVSISRRVDENIELTRDVLHAIHQDQWATLIGLHETTMQAVREAQAADSVNDHVFASIATREADLRKQRHLFNSLVQGHVRALDAEPASRRTYIQKNLEQIVADTHGMLMAEGSWYRAQVLRAGHIIRDEANAHENERLLEQLAADTKREHAQAMEEATGLLATLTRQTRLMAELPGELSLPFTAKRRDVREAAAMAEALSERVAELQNWLRPEPVPINPPIAVFRDKAPDDVMRILPWALPDDAAVLAIADVNLDRLVGENAYLVVTAARLFLTGHGALRKQGELEQTLLLDDIRYVRFREREKQGPVLDIITMDENVRVTFDGWASKGPGLERARRLGELLAAAMNLPESEQRTDPLLAVEAAEMSAIAG